MHFLWWLLLIPVGLIGLGLLVFVVGEEAPPFFEGRKPRQILWGIYCIGAVGFWISLVLCMIFAPALVLYFFAHLSYDASALIGMPLGFVAAVLLLLRFVREAPKSSVSPYGNEGSEELLPPNKYENK